MTRKTAAIAGICVALAACAPGERIQQTRRPAPSLVSALAPELDAALLEWEAAGGRALRTGPAVAGSLRERIRFPADAPHAVGYRVALWPGEPVRVHVQEVGGGPAPAVDVFEVLGGGMYRLVSSYDALAGEIEYRATYAGDHVVRVQPRPGAGGLVEIRIGAAGRLPFPVADVTPAAVGSVFGDPRDGGARGHEGVDIFAPRGTPVVAVAAGRVTGVQTTRAGGRVVWIEDPVRGLSYYYAHLDEQRVKRGQLVQAYDTIGTVGNTGNAAAVRPHLHFGIYRPGTVALDPGPLLTAGVQEHDVGLHAADVALHDGLLGRWSSVAGERVRLRAGPAATAPIITVLEAGTPVFVLGTTGAWHRVLLQDGTGGFIAVQFAAPPDDAG